MPNIEDFFLEHHFEHLASLYFGRLVRQLRVLEPTALLDMIEDAFDEGRLTWDERVSVLLADLVMSGRHRDTGQDVYLLVEVAGRIETHDVNQAVERAALLEKLGQPVLPAVAGTSIDDRAAALADEKGVSYALGGPQLRDATDLSPAQPPRR